MLPPLRTGPLVVAGIAALSGACARDSLPARARASAPASTGRTSRPPTLVTPGRLLAFSDSAASQVALDAEGSRRAIVHGMRLLEHSDGTIERGDQLLPSRKTARSLELPKRLGGGFLFYVEESNSTAVWKTASFTGKLEPFANLNVDVAQIVAGFDRLYVIEKGGDVLALDPETGEARDKGSLPASPGYSSMAFADPWLGAVDVPMRGLLASFDAGSSWHPVGVSAQSVTLDNGELVIRNPEGDWVLDASGHLRQRAVAAAGDSAFQPAPGREAIAPALESAEHEESRVMPPGPLGRRPLRLAALHGWPDSPNTAVVAHDGTLGRVRLRDGKVLEFAEHAYPEGGSCHAVQMLDGFGFVCGQERGKTTVYAFQPPLGLRPLIGFPEPRYVAASGNGALVIRGDCPDARGPAQAGAYCIVDSEGRARSLIVRGDLGVERVTALRDGRTAVIVPPRLGAPGLLTLVDAAGNANSVKLKLPGSDSSVLALLKKGLWLDGFTEPKPGVLAGWVVASGPFVGVRISQDGAVLAGRVTHDIDRAVLAGPFALVFSRAGLAKETIDGGFRYRDLELPVDLDTLSRKSPVNEQRAEQGCTAVGCAFGDWLRIGWSGTGELQELETVETPAPTPRPSPGGSRWVLACTSTGESSAPSKSVVEPTPRLPRFALPPSSPAATDEIENSVFRWFLELAPPARRSGDLGFDHGTETDAIQLRAYVWGVRGAPWDRSARWQAKVADRFTVTRGAWSTEPTRSPWNDQATSAQTFGADPNSSTPTNWRAALEPSGRAAALLITARATTELYLLEEDRSIVAVRDAAKPAPFGEPLSVVKLDSAWFLGAPSGNQSFRLFKIEGDRIELLREYPLRLPANAVARATVVRTSRGSGLGIAIKSASLFVYPIDPKSGEPGDVLEIPAHALSQLPTGCDTDQDGWLVTDQLGVSPYVEFSSEAESVRVRDVEARLIVSTLGVCTEGLAAKSEAPIAVARKATPTHRSAGVPLVVTDRSPNGRRWGFRCRQ